MGKEGSMGLVKSALLAGSQSTWLRERATRLSFVQRSVSRFMPGEHLSDATAACAELRSQRIPTILTRLGENVNDLSEAEAVTRHYVEVLDEVQRAGLDTQISIKPTHLGLDLGADETLENVNTLVAHATRTNNFVWIDMESTAYVDRTLELFRKVRASSDRVGICLQSYLRRTPRDVETLVPLGSAIRLVKGAYKEPPDLAFPKKLDTDAAFYDISARLLAPDARAAGVRLGIGTHDPRLVRLSSRTMRSRRSRSNSRCSSASSDRCRRS
jgi:proline dehydrogenase